VSSDGGHCGDGGARRWMEVALDGKAASANEGGGWLSASMVPCGGQWLSGRPGMAQRHMRAVRSGQRLALGVEVHGERLSRVGERSVVVVGRGENELLLRTDSERRRRTGRQLHALREEAGRQLARGGDAALVVGVGTVEMMPRRARKASDRAPY
jgi:hypothetical protein